MTDKTDPGSMTTRQLRARRRRLARSLPDTEGLIAGSVVEQGRRCGKEGCRCATGQAHGPYTYVVLPRSGGRARTVYIPASAAEAVRRGAATSTQARAALANRAPSALETRGGGGGEDPLRPPGAQRAHLRPPVVAGPGPGQHRVDRPPVWVGRGGGPPGLGPLVGGGDRCRPGPVGALSRAPLGLQGAGGAGVSGRGWRPLPP